MAKVVIKVRNGEGGLQHEWDGNRDDGLRIINEIKARFKNLWLEEFGVETGYDAEATFTAYTHQCLDAAFRGEPNDEDAKAIVALVLSCDHDKLPGRFVDHLDDDTGFIFDLVEKGEGFSIKADGLMRRSLNA
jgi:hypothetical protein